MYADDAPISPQHPYVELAVEVFAMLADATRVRIVLALQDGELSVGELVEIVGRAPAGVSQHLGEAPHGANCRDSPGGAAGVLSVGE